MRIQNEDIKSEADLLAKGGTKDQLPGASKVYIASFGLSKTLEEAISERRLHGQPLLMTQGYPADSKVYFRPSIVETIEGSGRAHAPIKSQIFKTVLSSFDMQSGVTSGLTFDGTIPVSTAGWFTRAGFSLLASGVMKVLFAEPKAVYNDLANEGTLFVKGAQLCGWLDLEYTSATAVKSRGAASNVIQNKVGSNITLFTFGAGSGGSGSGDANSILETIKNTHNESLFEYVTPNIFSQDQSTYIDTNLSTAQYDVANENIKFSAASQLLIVKENLEQTFKDDERVIKNLFLQAYWSPTQFDPGAIYQVSRDGGQNWNTVTMERLGVTELATANYVFPRETILGVIASNSGASVIPLTPTNNKRSSKFTLNFDVIGMDFYIPFTKLGSPTGFVTVSIVRDNGGVPSTLASDILVTSSRRSIAGISGSLSYEFPEIYLATGTYHIVVEVDSNYTASSYSAGVTELRLSASVGGPNDGAVYDSGLSTWSTSTTALSHSISGFVQELQLSVQSSDAGYGLAALPVYYGEPEGGFVTGIDNSEAFVFSGDDNTTEFLVTRFIVEPKLLKVYDINSGQVYRYGAFEVAGNTVKFASGQFYEPGQQVSLLFDQNTGGAFDNSDQNALLLASNFLGSTDPNIDRSQPGRGIMLRRPDGVLIELAVDNNNQPVVYSTT